MSPRIRPGGSELGLANPIAHCPPQVTFGYEIFPEKRAIAMRYAGTCTLAQLAATLRLLWADPRYSREFIGVVDLTQGTVGFGIDELRKLITFLRASEQTSRGRWAAVTTSPVATAIVMIYRQAMLRQHTFEVFSSWEAACDFVGIEMTRDVPERAVPEI